MRLFSIVFLLLFINSAFGQSGWVNYNKDNSPLLSSSVSSIAVDHDNNLWGAYAGAGGQGNGIVKFNGYTWTHYNVTNSGLANDDIRDIAVDLQGNMWFACYNAGIVKFNGTTWTRYYKANSNIAGNDVVDIEFDSNGNLWAGCYFSGVSKFDGTSWTTYTKNNAPFPDSNCISDLTIDKENNIWVGMDCAGGMAKFSSSSGTWTGYKTANSSIPDHTVTSLLADTSGVIWASHINVNVSSFNGSNWTTYNVARAIDHFTLDEKGNLWGCGYGLYKFESGRWNGISIPPAADTTYAFGAAGDRAGNFWLSTYSGLWIKPVNAPPVFEVEMVVVDEDFETFKVGVNPALVRDYEKWQTVTYTVINLDEQKITAAINPLTGEIILTSIKDAFGTATLKIIANDGQELNNIYETLTTITIRPIVDNTSPVFEVETILVNEDFETFKVPVKPGPVPEDEQSQTVTYTLVNLDEQNIKASINPLTGEITLTSVADAFGTATLKIIANDGQALNNTYEVLVTITIKSVEDIITGLERGVEDEVIFFPNPISTTLSWINKSSSSCPSGTLVITDMMGREVKRFFVTADDASINASDLPSGIYLVKLDCGHGFSKLYRIVKGR